MKKLASTKLKVFAEEKLSLAKMMIPAFDGIENVVGKGENAMYQHFLLFPTMISKDFFLGVNKSRDCMVKS